MKKEKIYCLYCKYIKIGKISNCSHPENKISIPTNEKWLCPDNKIVYKMHPSIINKNNDCSWFEADSENEIE